MVLKQLLSDSHLFRLSSLKTARSARLDMIIAWISHLLPTWYLFLSLYVRKVWYCSAYVGKNGASPDKKCQGWILFPVQLCLQSSSQCDIGYLNNPKSVNTQWIIKVTDMLFFKGKTKIFENQVPIANMLGKYSSWNCGKLWNSILHHGTQKLIKFLLLSTV